VWSGEWRERERVSRGKEGFLVPRPSQWWMRAKDADWISDLRLAQLGRQALRSTWGPFPWAEIGDHPLAFRINRTSRR
jgi:hypothetical protein